MQGARNAETGMYAGVHGDCEYRATPQTPSAAIFKTASKSPAESSTGLQRGFTLVELVMTMVIVGLIAAVALPRFFDVSVFQERGAADQVKAALRYGQKIAIAQRRTAGVSVTITAGSTSNCGANLNATGNVDCVIKTGVAVNKPLPWTVTFYARGNPGAADSITVGTTTIAIEAETGYVH